MTDSDVTRLLRSLRGGDESAYSRLMPLVYDELRQLAQSHLRRERPDHTLESTELVNEAYLRLAGDEHDWESRAHFFGVAAIAMRRILVEHARRRASQKRGGQVQRVTFNDLAIEAVDPDIDLLELDDAMTALEEFDPRLSQVVHLRFFAELSIEETAKTMGLSPATVKRDWTYARAWLYERMSDADRDERR